jgi:phosphate transport system protein
MPDVKGAIIRLGSRSSTPTRRAVAAADDEIDRLCRAIIGETRALMAADGANAERDLRIVFAAHYLERAGDRMTNIAEDVVFLATGHVEDLNQ